MLLRYPARDASTPLEYLGLLPSGTDACGPKGRGFHNHLFVAALRRVLMQEPNVDLLVGRVTGVLTDEGPHVVGVKWVDEAGAQQTSKAPLSVLSDGYFSVLRKVRRARLWAGLPVV